jgi:lysozyme family protein
MTNLEIALKFTLKWEGGYSNDPNDPGGETKFGISKRYHQDLDIKNLTLEGAVGIYNTEYWEPCGCAILDLPLAVCVFDTAVNRGVSKALQYLQTTKDPLEYIGLRRDGYYAIVLKNPSQKKYINGWINRINDLRKYVEILQQT